mmetsp:Transcript_11243/g.35882  ORF Transcript_11243/g.35882 Transcript_11243/m.35882 type:complete len:317 (+) Transcript_11243:1620-2570(+)
MRILRLLNLVTKPVKLALLLAELPLELLGHLCCILLCSSGPLVVDCQLASLFTGHANLLLKRRDSAAQHLRCLCRPALALFAKRLQLLLKGFAPTLLQDQLVEIGSVLLSQALQVSARIAQLVLELPQCAGVTLFELPNSLAHIVSLCLQLEQLGTACFTRRVQLHTHPLKFALQVAVHVPKPLKLTVMFVQFGSQAFAMLLAEVRDHLLEPFLLLFKRRHQLFKFVLLPLRIGQQVRQLAGLTFEMSDAGFKVLSLNIESSASSLKLVRGSAHLGFEIAQLRLQLADFGPQFTLHTLFIGLSPAELAFKLCDLAG